MLLVVFLRRSIHTTVVKYYCTVYCTELVCYSPLNSSNSCIKIKLQNIQNNKTAQKHQKQRCFSEKQSFTKQKKLFWKWQKCAELTVSCVKQKVMRAETEKKCREWKRNRGKEKHIKLSRTLVLRLLTCYMKRHPMGPLLHETREGREEEERVKTWAEVGEEGGKSGGVTVEENLVPEDWEQQKKGEPLTGCRWDRKHSILLNINT